MTHGHVTMWHCNVAQSCDSATLQCCTVNRRHVHHSIMLTVTWQRFDQSAKWLTVGHATIDKWYGKHSERHQKQRPGSVIWFGSWLARLNTFSSSESISGRAPVAMRWSLKRDSALRLRAATSSENLSVVEQTSTLSSGSMQHPNDLPHTTQQQPPIYGHYTGQPALADTYS